MKTTKILLVSGLLMAVSSTGYSQDFDTNRMGRDINIMENILNELFRYNRINDSNEHVVVSISGHSQRTTGTYLPGYGVVFQVSRDLMGLTSVHVERARAAAGYSYYYSNDEDSEEKNSEKNTENKITEEEIIERVTEFFRDYAVNISQLQNDEKILVIYGTHPQSFRYFQVQTLVGGSSQKEPGQLISVSVSKKDLDAYRARQINEDTFRSRLVVEKSENKESADLRVLANIFETALKDVPENSFRISGKVDYLNLDNFGALYSMEVRYNHGNYRLAPNMVTVGGSRLKNELVYSYGRDSAATAEVNEKREELEKKIKEAYDRLKEDIREYLVDYGRTLRSLNNSQHIWLNVTVSKSWLDVELPEMMEIQIKKSVLDQYDKGSISREQALNEVRITEH